MRGRKTQEVICQRSPQATGTTVFWVEKKRKVGAIYPVRGWDQGGQG